MLVAKQDIQDAQHTRLDHANDLLRAISKHCPGLFCNGTDAHSGFIINDGYVHFFDAKSGQTTLLSSSEIKALPINMPERSMLYRLAEYIHNNTEVSPSQFNPAAMDSVSIAKHCTDIDALRRAIVTNPALNIDGKSAKPFFWRLAALLPEIKAGEEVYERDFKGATSENQLIRAAKRYNKVLAKAFDALCEDSRAVNSRSTLEQAFQPKDFYSTWFNRNDSTHRYLSNVVMSASLNGHFHQTFADDMAEWRRLRAQVELNNQPVMAM